MLISIITVCYNSEKFIKDTIKSILSQTYHNIECVIVDGLSKDNTMAIVKEYASCNENIKYISEKDNGIYDAMNKGLKMASGDIIFFLNSGDRFYDENVVNDVANEFVDTDCDFLYGNIMMVNGENHIVKKFDNVDRRFLLRESICHQAIFCKKHVFSRTDIYNTHYRISSDYEWTIKCFIDKEITMHYYDRVISFYDTTGISSDINNFAKMHIERKKIINKYLNIEDMLYSEMYYFNILLRLKIKKMMRLS